LILGSLTKQLESPAELPLNSHEYNSKLLFCLSTLLRNFPFAQKEFVRFGGVELFDKLVGSSTSLKVKLKAVTLLNDLIEEKINSVKSPNEPNSNESKSLQYKE
jgi:nucleotide exchange factor SIL1